MSSAADTLAAALVNEAGRAVPITKIELEVLGVQFRWTLWSHTKRLYSIASKPHELPGCLQATQILLEKNLQLPPQTNGAYFNGTPR